ncbi:MAG: aminotransferase class IV, partial [Chloroflexi bacterium]|nr:aminotransferase class IV [Chloroflexota bacterium]
AARAPRLQYFSGGPNAMAKDDVSANRDSPVSAPADTPPPPIPQHPPYLWHNGRLVPWADATVHLTDIGWTAISAVFEGIRVYAQTDDGLAFFRVDQHLKRLGQSMKLMRMEPPFPLDELRQGMADLLQANGARHDGYFQPTAYFGGNIPGYRAAYTQPGNFYVTLREAPSHLGEAAGVHLCVSTWARIGDNVMPPRVKAMSNYQNSRLVSTEARINGYDGGIMLNDRGKVAEGASSCIFLIRDGVAITPSITSGILESITRAPHGTVSR